MKINRSKIWQNIWDRKGHQAEGLLHHIDGFDLLDEKQWDDMVYQVTQPIGIANKDSILECGCGAGAFLSSLLKQYPELNISGVDYSQSLIDKVKKNLKGDFYYADMSDISFIKDNTFDHTLSFSTFHYLSSEDIAIKVVKEMVRVTKNGGVIFIGEVSDLERQDQAFAIRQKTHQHHKKVSAENPDHLFLSKNVFKIIAQDMNLALRIIDQQEFNLPYYETAKYRFSVYLFKK